MSCALSLNANSFAPFAAAAVLSLGDGCSNLRSGSAAALTKPLPRAMAGVIAIIASSARHIALLIVLFNIIAPFLLIQSSSHISPVRILPHLDVQARKCIADTYVFIAYVFA
jgi:hypothetical protein